MSDVLGLHLVAHLDLIASPRRSVVARLDAAGRLRALEPAGSDAEILALIDGTDAPLVVADAPLEVTNPTGRRDVEAVLAWCDIPVFPVSERRLDTVFGGARGVGLAPALAHGGRRVREALPDQVLRQIAWEADHPPGSAALDLADYRAAWLGVRAPRYRPKGVGRADPRGVVAAWRLLAGVVDMDGWTPATDPDDWAAIGDAARLDAICCAYAGLRLEQPEGGLCVGAPGLGRVALPVDANLRGRVEATLARLRAEGAIAI
jgi:predicted nuclease with RNAse H fold